MSADFANIPSLFKTLDLSSFSQEQRKQIQAIDAVLPQTQCGLCGHPDGCLPYATAIVKGETHNKCVPGGQAVSDKIAQLTNRKILKAEPSKWQTDPQTNRPLEMRAVIIEDDCIGCTKCISACPVDAIIGSGKQMHTIFTELCTGCELCLPPCPVDCIELVPYPRAIDEKSRQAEQTYLKQRYYAHLNRVEQAVNDKNNTKPTVSMVEAKLHDVSIEIDANQAKDTIELAKIRTQIKKLEKQLSVRFDQNKQNTLNVLLEKLQNVS